MIAAYILYITLVAPNGGVTVVREDHPNRAECFAAKKENREAVDRAAGYKLIELECKPK